MLPRPGELDGSGGPCLNYLGSGLYLRLLLELALTFSIRWGCGAGEAADTLTNL